MSASAGTVVTLQTTCGELVVRLYDDAAPKTVANFLQYVRDGFYDGTIFHRVIDGFMVQGGGFTADLRQKPTRGPVANEANNGRKNRRGTLAMARTSDPHSATAQFFINVTDNAFLDHRAPTPDGWGYCVFGEVIRGLETLDAIRLVPTGARPPHRDVPLQPVSITAARVGD